MKLRAAGEPDDSGHYALPREIVLEVLRRHFVKIDDVSNQYGNEMFLLERKDDFIVLQLPGTIAAGMVFRLAAYYQIPPEEFYNHLRERHAH